MEVATYCRVCMFQNHKKSNYTLVADDRDNYYSSPPYHLSQLPTRSGHRHVWSDQRKFWFKNHCYGSRPLSRRRWSWLPQSTLHNRRALERTKNLGAKFWLDSSNDLLRDTLLKIKRSILLAITAVSTAGTCAKASGWWESKFIALSNVPSEKVYQVEPLPTKAPLSVSKN